jgi:hypothetical protein
MNLLEYELDQGSSIDLILTNKNVYFRDWKLDKVERYQLAKEIHENGVCKMTIQNGRVTVIEPPISREQVEQEFDKWVQENL